TVAITALNVPPTANAGADQTVNEGDTVTLTGTFTDPGTADTFTQTWVVKNSVGNTVASGSGASIQFVPDDDDVKSVMYTRMDDDGGTDTGTVKVTALNVPPTAYAGDNQTVNEGDTVTLTGTFTDPGTADSFTQTWVVTNSAGTTVASGSGASIKFVPAD